MSPKAHPPDRGLYWCWVSVRLPRLVATEPRIIQGEEIRSRLPPAWEPGRVRAAESLPTRRRRTDLEGQAVHVISVNERPDDITPTRSPRKWNDRNGNRDVEGLSLSAAWRSTYVKLPAQAERLITCRRGHKEGRAVLVLDYKLDPMAGVRLIPLDFDHAGDRERLRLGPDLLPSAAENEQQAFPYFGAIRKKSLNAQQPDPRAGSLNSSMAFDRGLAT